MQHNAVEHPEVSSGEYDPTLLYSAEEEPTPVVVVEPPRRGRPRHQQGAPRGPYKSYTTAEKLEIVAYAKKHGTRAAVRKFEVSSPSVVQAWCRGKALGQRTTWVGFVDPTKPTPTPTPTLSPDDLKRPAVSKSAARSIVATKPTDERPAPKFCHQCGARL
jgi:hypothetical protein